MRIYGLSLKKKHLKKSLRAVFWFTTGAILAIFFLTTFSFLVFERIYSNRVYPGVFVTGKNLGGKTYGEVINFYRKKNNLINTTFIFTFNDNEVATIPAKTISFGYDDRLFAAQAYSVGRSKNSLTDSYLILKAYTQGVFLSTAYKYSQPELQQLLSKFSKSIDENPINAQFKFENGKVVTFQPSENGRGVDWEKLNSEILVQGENILRLSPKTIKIEIPIKVLKPQISTEDVNNFGIKELIGTGKSTFYDSIQSRIYNIKLAASRLNGTLVPPGQIFSFDNTLGDVSSFTGYQQAYIIQNGKTILGDGGGVCQVSTTFFRAILNAGLPVVERHAHSYRVGYYEQDSPPGFDATVYVPTVDLKFINDTNHYILIQESVDLSNMSLTFNFYGTSDGRKVSISQPVVTNKTPAPPPLYQDDPTLPNGEIKQVDFAASGADVYFTRTVSKKGKIIIYDKFVSDYQPWQAVYLRGTRG